MKLLYTSLVAALILTACAGSKNPSASTVEKLIRKNERKPGDTLIFRQLLEAYQTVQRQDAERIKLLEYTNTPDAWEKIGGLYEELAELQENAERNNELRNQFQPEDYQSKARLAKSRAAGLYFNDATIMLGKNNWESARKAYYLFQKVTRLSGDYPEAASYMKQAKTAGTLLILIQPLTSEGLFTQTNAPYFADNRLAEQMINDLRSSYAGNDWFRVIGQSNTYQADRDPDWIAQPVWTNWRSSPVNYRQYKKNLSRQVQAGKDSSNKPIYKTVYAVLNITEASVASEGTLELRITDVRENRLAAMNSWREKTIWKNTYATYSGDASALDDEDWLLVRQRKERAPGDEHRQVEVLQKIYPDLLSWFRRTAG